MAFWQLLTLVGTMATILGVSLAVYALINNRTLKAEERLTREEIRLSREEMKTETKLTREIIVKMEEGLKEILREIAKKTDEIAQMTAFIASGQKEIAHLIQKTQELIVVEGERTRREIK
ncbi:MAG: hypothetical protein AB1595_02420 [bacterium]